MKDRLLSVIITAYNAESTIERCVASVFEGTPCEHVKLLEIIVVDDASEDKTTDKLNSFTDRIELVRLQTNSVCIAKPRNIGLDYVSGKYPQFITGIGLNSVCLAAFKR